MYFNMKSYLKSNRYYTVKHTLSVGDILNRGYIQEVEIESIYCVLYCIVLYCIYLFSVSHAKT